MRSLLSASVTVASRRTESWRNCAPESLQGNVSREWMLECLVAHALEKTTGDHLERLLKKALQMPSAPKIIADYMLKHWEKPKIRRWLHENAKHAEPVRKHLNEITANAISDRITGVSA
jgi:hypothetical protein